LVDNYYASTENSEKKNREVIIKLRTFQENNEEMAKQHNVHTRWTKSIRNSHNWYIRTL